jgi:tryptophan synthase alpha chain
MTDRMKDEEVTMTGDAVPTPLAEAFGALRSEGSGALITYFPIGIGIDAVELAAVYDESGVDVLEIGLPTRNPYLDGPTVAGVMASALDAGFTVEKCLSEIGRIRTRFPRKPLEVFTYAEVVAGVGVDRFVKLCEDNGVDSALIGGSTPGWLKDAASWYPSGMDLLGLAPFDYTEEFARSLAKAPLSGYVFLQATPGVTGERDSVEPELGNRIASLREHLGELPICTGFGISNPSHARAMRQAGADGVIVGSLALKWLTMFGVAEFTARIRPMKAALADA